jgi:hypothetical protein
MHVQEGVWQELWVQEKMHEVPHWMFLQWDLLCMMCVCVCVCVWSPVKGGGVVKHVIPIAKSSPPCRPFHTLELSSTTPWDPRGGVHKGVPTSPCISVWTPWPQLGGLFHSLDSVPIRSSLQAFWEKRRRVSVLLPHQGTALTLRGNFSMKVWASQIEAASVCSYGAGQRMGINYRLHMGRYNGPIQVVQKHGHKSIISKRHQVGRHGLYSGHYSGVFVAPTNP